MKGNAFPSKVDSAVEWIGRIPTAYTATTGLTFTLLLAEDQLNPGGATVARFAVTVKLLTSGTDVLDWTVAGTQTAASVTMPATGASQAIVKTLSIPIVAANLDSVVADSWCAIRIQRLGKSDALDVNPGRFRCRECPAQTRSTPNRSPLNSGTAPRRTMA
jgi:hypothetical protein